MSTSPQIINFNHIDTKCLGSQNVQGCWHGQIFLDERKIFTITGKAE